MKIKQKIKNYILSLFPKFERVIEFIIIYKNNHIKYDHDGLWTTSTPYFIKDQRFINAYKKGLELIPKTWPKNFNFEWRAYIACWYADQAAKLNGDFIECGTNTGMYSRMLIEYLSFTSLDKKMLLIDTYSGLDIRYSSDSEMERSNNMGYNQKNIYSDVKKTFKDFSNVEVIQGVVPDILVKFKDKKFCYVAIDMNCVYPEKKALEILWDQIVPGGVIILDDHSFEVEQGNTHRLFAQNKNVEILTLPTGQGIIIKP